LKIKQESINVNKIITKVGKLRRAYKTKDLLYLSVRARE